MPARDDYLAIDLGASSGRAVLGTLERGRLNLREVHRFPNAPIERPTGLHWDAPRLFEEITRSISLATRLSPRLAGVGIDAWGVDYALLSDSGWMLDLPHHYRDPRTHGLMDQAFVRVPRARIYSRTGIQFLPFNTLYQLLVDQQDGRLARAHTLLFIPDLFNAWLTGVSRTERTIASTSQLFDTAANAWADDLIQEFGLPRHIFPPIDPPGTPIGPFLPSLAVGCSPTVIAPASHDSGSAIAGVPAIGDDWAYVSSGTWSLVGRELRTPNTSHGALAENFTNESGLDGTIRFHKNVAGLWLLQESRRAWEKASHPIAIEKLLDLARGSTPRASLIDPDHDSLSRVGDDMPERIREFCRRTRQPIPDSPGAVSRCILESLALKTAWVIATLERLTGPVRRIHVVGGGAQNPLLCQFTADATARPVLAGPVEATAAGNIISQALALGRLPSFSSARASIRDSFPPVEYLPTDVESWRDATGRFRGLLASPPA